MSGKRCIMGCMEGGFHDRARRIAPVLALSLLASACAAPKSHYGISLAPGAAPAEVQDLARRAAAGDKHAQLDLGIRYEEGNGVPRDLKRARQLYRLAAPPSGGTMYVYRSEEHTSELQSLMRISYAVFCLKTKTT